MIAAFYGWDIDWGSVTTSAALGAVGVPGALKTGTKIYKNIQDGLKMRKRIKTTKQGVLPGYHCYNNDNISS